MVLRGSEPRGGGLVRARALLTAFCCCTLRGPDYAGSSKMPRLERAAKKAVSQAPLYDAARQGDLSTVTQLLSEEGGARAVNEELSKGSWRALHAAAHAGHTEVSRLLLEHGAHLEAETEGGWTALHWAAHSGHTAMVELLLESGSLVQANNSDGWTALHIAAHAGHADVIESLLQRGASLAALDHEGWPALHWAAHEGHSHSLMTLVEHGAAVSYLDRTGWGALQIGVRHGHAAVVVPLVKSSAEGPALLQVLTQGQQTVLHLGAFYGHAAVVAALLQVGADIEVKDVSRRTPLQLAAQKGHAAVCRVLSEAGAVLDGLDSDHATAMHAAAYFGHAEVLQVLLAAGAASELVNSDGFTPLHFATSAKHPDAVAVLLQGGANTSAETADHLTPADLVTALQEEGGLRIDEEQSLHEIDTVLDEWGGGVCGRAAAHMPPPRIGQQLRLCSSVHLVRPLIKTHRTLKWTTKKAARLGSECDVLRVGKDTVTVRYQDGKEAKWPKYGVLQRRHSEVSASIGSSVTAPDLIQARASVPRGDRDREL